MDWLSSIALLIACGIAYLETYEKWKRRFRYVRVLTVIAFLVGLFGIWNGNRQHTREASASEKQTQQLIAKADDAERRHLDAEARQRDMQNDLDALRAKWKIAAKRERFPYKAECLTTEAKATATVVRNKR